MIGNGILTTFPNMVGRYKPECFCRMAAKRTTANKNGPKMAKRAAVHNLPASPRLIGVEVRLLRTRQGTAKYRATSIRVSTLALRTRPNTTPRAITKNVGAMMVAICSIFRLYTGCNSRRQVI